MGLKNIIAGFMAIGVIGICSAEAKDNIFYKQLQNSGLKEASTEQFNFRVYAKSDGVGIAYEVWEKQSTRDVLVINDFDDLDKFTGKDELLRCSLEFNIGYSGKRISSAKDSISCSGVSYNQDEARYLYNGLKTISQKIIRGENFSPDKKFLKAYRKLTD